jgi:hypothetical protein
VRVRFVGSGDAFGGWTRLAVAAGHRLAAMAAGNAVAVTPGS